jgi:hypothetical protein
VGGVEVECDAQLLGVEQVEMQNTMTCQQTSVSKGIQTSSCGAQVRVGLSRMYNVVALCGSSGDGECGTSILSSASLPEPVAEYDLLSAPAERKDPLLFAYNASVALSGPNAR